MAGIAGSVRAAVRLSNLETPPGAAAAIGATNYKAQPFRTSGVGPFEVGSLTLRMTAGSNGGGQFFVAIYTGDTAPVAPAPNGRLTGEANPLAAGTYTYTATGLTLDPNTIYWIVAGVSAGSGSYRWGIAANAVYPTAEWSKVDQFGFSLTEGEAWTVQATSTPYQFSLATVATGTIGFAGADNFDDNDLGTIAPGNRWRFNTPLTGTTGTAFTNRDGALDFTSSGAGRNVRFLGWITPTSSGGSYAYDWVATIDARNVTNLGAGYTLAGFEAYTLAATSETTVSSSAYYGLYLANFANISSARTRILAERGVWSEPAGDYVRSSVFTPLPIFEQRSGVLRLQWTAASRTLTASYSANGRDFITVRTFAVGGADAGLGAPFANGFGLQVVGFADGGARVAVGEIQFDNMAVVTSLAPLISAQPTNVAVTAGQSASFVAEVTGSRPIAYQWFKNDIAIPDANTSILRFPRTTAADAAAYKFTATNSLGTVTSATASLSVPASVVITRHPEDVTRIVGASATFSVAATVTPAAPLTYQWLRNGVKIPGATAATLTVNPVTNDSFGDYFALVTSPTVTVPSFPARLIQSDILVRAPVIERQPRGVTINRGATLVLSVTAFGLPYTTYQWHANGVLVPGINVSTLVLPNAQAADAGVYTATVSTLGGRVTSDAAIVRVGDGFSRQLNLSTRGFAGTDANTLIPGFVIAGSNPKRLLIRAAGPALAAFGVSGTIADPQIEVISNGTKVLTNDNWSADPTNAAAVRAAAAASGAFAFPEGSKDAAVVVTLPPGSGSILVTGVGGATGEAIVEIYDLDEADPARSRLINLATRAYVPATNTGNPLITGFVVQGPIAKTVLVRATGPALAGFGVAGTLARPVLNIFNNAGAAVAGNVNWESAGISDEIIAAAQSVGAFALTRGSADSVVLAVLPPGNYTAQVTGADGPGGVALVEVYELP